MNFFCWLYWNPPREAFYIPYFHHPVFWYGILFVTGFVLGYFIINPLLVRFLSSLNTISELDIKNWPPFIHELRVNSIFDASGEKKTKREIVDLLNQKYTRKELQKSLKTLSSDKQTAYLLTDRMCWFAVIGTVIGARLGDVFFYNWPYFKAHPWEILQIWHGGLASHGGVLGIMFALYLYAKYLQTYIPQLTFLRLLDYVAVPSALTACFIRLGNFMNQEIVGSPTTLPWGIIFGHPAEGVPPLPRHPVQLYEAAAYLVAFFILLALWKKNPVPKKPGIFVGSLFIFIFGSRLILEFWKETQESSLVKDSFFQMGQWLSIPFIILGFYLVIKANSYRICKK